MHIYKITLILGFVLSAIACSNAENTQNEKPHKENTPLVMTDDQKQPQTLELIGHIRYQNLEGGFFGFIDQKGNKYTLRKLPKEHLIDGLKLKISAEIMSDMVTTTQFGELL